MVASVKWIPPSSNLAKETIHNNVNKSTQWSAARGESVVPFPMEVATLNRHGVHVFVGDGLACLIGGLVQFGENHQSLGRTRGRNQIHHDHAGDQGTAAPVLRYVAEHSMLDLVPFARTGREVPNMQAQPQFIGKALEFGLPQAHPRPIASAAVGGDQESTGRKALDHTDSGELGLSTGLSPDLTIASPGDVCNWPFYEGIKFTTDCQNRS